jgi:hypothetical protein
MSINHRHDPAGLWQRCLLNPQAELGRDTPDKDEDNWAACAENLGAKDRCTLENVSSKPFLIV